MFSNRAGFHTKHQGETFSTHDFYTFSPTPICEVNVRLDDELCSLLSNAHRQLGLLEGSCHHISGVENINSLMLKKEAMASCAIDDNIKFSCSDLFASPKHNTDTPARIYNHINALEYGLCSAKSSPLTNKLVLATHGILMEHRKDNQLTGVVRKKQNRIGDYAVSISGMPSYNPPAPDELGSCMKDIETFIKRDDAMDVLIKTALLHYQFEVIHPFESGNGKIGRILVLMYLLGAKALTRTILPISEFLEFHKVEYFDRLKAVHNVGDYEQWIKFFLKALTVSAETSMRRIENVLQLRDRNQTLIRTNANNARNEKYLLDAYRYSEKHIQLNATILADGIAVSYNTAAKTINTLADLGIVRLLKAQERNRVFLNNDFLKSVGMMPEGI